jgi:hypothetical protein
MGMTAGIRPTNACYAVFILAGEVGDGCALLTAYQPAAILPVF